MSDIDTAAIIERPVYTKDEQYVGVVEDIDKEQEIGNLIIRGSLDLRRFSVPRKFIVNFYNGKLLLDMTRDDFLDYAM
jgi:sporulation protein YlmC with PRC-barrel domain